MCRHTLRRWLRHSGDAAKHGSTQRTSLHMGFVRQQPLSTSQLLAERAGQPAEDRSFKSGDSKRLAPMEHAETVAHAAAS